MPIRHAILTGTLARTPEKKAIGDYKVAIGRLAVSQGRDKPTIWFDLTAWSQWPAADLLACAKGTRITVSGRLTMRAWTAKDGSLKEGLGLDVDAVEAPRREAPAGDTFDAPTSAVDVDDLPF